MYVMIMGDTRYLSNWDKSGCSPAFDGDAYGQQLSWSGASPNMYNQFISPNNNNAADSLVSVYAHELFETVTDGGGDAWYGDCQGYEIGDLCNSVLGQVQTKNGKNYNLDFNGNYFLVQTMWLQSSKGCALTIHNISNSGYNTYAPTRSTGQDSFYLSTPYVIGIIIAVAICLIILILSCVKRMYYACNVGGIQQAPIPTAPLIYRYDIHEPEPYDAARHGRAMPTNAAAPAYVHPTSWTNV